jgi:hypothetical protein
MLNENKNIVNVNNPPTDAPKREIESGKSRARSKDTKAQTNQEDIFGFFKNELTLRNAISLKHMWKREKIVSFVVYLIGFHMSTQY